MTVVLIDRYVSRAAAALERIVHASQAMSTLLPEARAIQCAIIEGEPQWVRDLEFVALEIETLEEAARRKLLMKSNDGQA